MKCIWDDTWITEKGLSAAEVLVLSKLQCFAMKCGRGNVVTTTYKHLCLTCGISYRTLMRILPEFELKGFIRQQIAAKGVLAYSFYLEETNAAENAEASAEASAEQKWQNAENGKMPNSAKCRVDDLQESAKCRENRQNAEKSGKMPKNSAKCRLNIDLNNNLNNIQRERVKNAPAHEEKFLISDHISTESIAHHEEKIIYTKLCMCQFGYLNPEKYVTKFLTFVAEKESEGRRFSDKTKSFERFMSKEINFGGQPTIGKYERIWLATLLDILEQRCILHFCNDIQDIQLRHKEMFIYLPDQQKVDAIFQWMKKQDIADHPKLAVYDYKISLLTKG